MDSHRLDWTRASLHLVAACEFCLVLSLRGHAGWQFFKLDWELPIDARSLLVHRIRGAGPEIILPCKAGHAQAFVLPKVFECDPFGKGRSEARHLTSVRVGDVPLGSEGYGASAGGDEHWLSGSEVDEDGPFDLFANGCEEELDVVSDSDLHACLRSLGPLSLQKAILATQTLLTERRRMPWRSLLQRPTGLMSLPHPLRMV